MASSAAGNCRHSALSADSQSLPDADGQCVAALARPGLRSPILVVGAAWRGGGGLLRPSASQSAQKTAKTVDGAKAATSLFDEATRAARVRISSRQVLERVQANGALECAPTH